MNIGDKFRKPYPFQFFCADLINNYGDHTTDELWMGGCKKNSDDGQCHPNYHYTCDAEGEIEFEILALVEMPRKYQDRVIYRISLIDPDGKEKHSPKDYTVTRKKFHSWIDKEGSTYLYQYEVTNDE